METAFSHYEPIDSKQEDSLWDHAVVTLDTNCLLHLYRYSLTTRSWFLKALSKLKDENRIWLSHQVGEEFYRNRPLVALKSRNSLKETKDLLEAVEKHIKKTLKQQEDVKDLLNKIIEVKREAEKAVDEISATGSKEPMPQHDEDLKELKRIFNSPSMIGPAYSREEMAKIYAEGRERYAQQIPPGYVDARSKPAPQCYGDLVIWKQLMDYSRHQNRPSIFVTGDLKDDWWFEVGAMKGPKIAHPKLRQEFQDTTGNVVWFYDRDDFLREAKKRLDPDISEESIEEVRATQETQEVAVSSPGGSWHPYHGQFAQLARAIANADTWASTINSTYFNAFAALNSINENPVWKLALGENFPGLADLQGTLGIVPPKSLDFVGPGMGYSSEPRGHEYDEGSSEADADSDSADNDSPREEEIGDSGSETEEE